MAASLPGRLVVLALQGGELETGRDPWEGRGQRTESAPGSGRMDL